MPFGDWSIFDAHCDTLDKLRQGGTLEKQALQFNLPAARRYARYVQVMAVWMDPERKEDARTFAEKGIDRLAVPAAYILKTKEDLCRHKRGPAFLLGIEGGEPINEISDISFLFQKGVRLVTLTWNGANKISDAALDKQMPGGLTAFGKQAVREMETLGMAVDVSHISEKGFWDVMETVKKPVIASHSCSKVLCKHPRNLTDAQFAAIRQNGGVVGVNFYPEFLGGESIDDVFRHIVHFLEEDGEDYVGFGSDFDGISSVPQGLSGAQDMYALIEQMLRGNIPETTVRKIAYGNMERYFLQILPQKPEKNKIF